MPSEESYKKVEGDWKDFRFRRIQPSDYPTVLEHVREVFIRDEETSKLLGWSQEFADDVNQMLERFLEDGMSFLAEHKPTGKLAGIRVTFHHTPDFTFDDVPTNSRSTQLHIKLVSELEDMADVSTKFGIESFAEFLIASTTPEFRNQGLASEFYDRSIEFLRAEGYQHVVVVVTSVYTRKAAIKRGFIPQAKLDYHDFLDYDGKPAFKKEDLTPDHVALLLLKTL